jgi:hypothetical protein
MSSTGRLLNKHWETFVMLEWGMSYCANDHALKDVVFWQVAKGRDACGWRRAGASWRVSSRIGEVVGGVAKAI